MFRISCFALPFALAIVFLVVGPAVADDKVHEGLVISATEGKLLMSDKEGKNEHTHMVPAGTKVTLDGKDAKLSDLKKGDAVKVTADPEGKVVAIAASRVGR